MEELVSIIIPAYQEEKRIERCLQSLLVSSYRNLELIVVNDGSTDDTEKIVRMFKKRNESKDIRIELVTVPNGGSARARNYGLHLAKGDYIGFVDADDMVHPCMIERLADSLRRGNELAICGLLYCNEEGKPGLFQYRLHGQKKQCPKQALTTIMWEQIQMSICSVLFLRKKIMDAEGRVQVFCPEDVVAFEDFAFICEYLGRCSGFMEVLSFRGYFYCRQTGNPRIYTAEELKYALRPILDTGNRIDDKDFCAHKLQYAFRFMALWYEKAIRCDRHDFGPDCEEWNLCMKELERYVDVYMKAANVALYKKAAMWIVRNCPRMGRVLARTIGKALFR